MTLHPPFLCRFDPARYSEFYLMSCVPEAKVQEDILDMLQWRGIPAVAVDVGAKKLRGRAVGALQAAGRGDLLHRLKGTTGAGVAGLVDVLGTIPGRLVGQLRGVPLFVEVKAPRWLHKSPRTGALIQKEREGLPTAQQLAFLDTMHRAGAVVGVAWGLDDLDFILAAQGVTHGKG